MICMIVIVLKIKDMNFNKKDDRIKYLEDKFDNLMDVIGSNYGEPLKKRINFKVKYYD